MKDDTVRLSRRLPSGQDKVPGVLVLAHPCGSADLLQLPAAPGSRKRGRFARCTGIATFDADTLNRVRDYAGCFPGFLANESGLGRLGDDPRRDIERETCTVAVYQMDFCSPLSSYVDLPTEAMVPGHVEDEDVEKPNSSEPSDLLAFLAERVRALGLPEWLRGFDLRNQRDVVRFVEGKAQLKKLLAEARERIPEHFGQTRLVLDVRPDREGSGPPELFLYVVTEAEPKEAGDNLRALEEDWWFGAVGSEPVNLHVEFV